MARETCLIEMGRGMAVVKYLRPAPAQDSYRFTPDHVAVEVGCLGGKKAGDDAELLETAKRGNRLRLIPEFSIDPAKYRVMVVPHPELLEVAELAYLPIIDPTDIGKNITIWARFLRDYDLSSLQYLCRLYMMTG